MLLPSRKGLANDWKLFLPDVKNPADCCGAFKVPWHDVKRSVQVYTRAFLVTSGHLAFAWDRAPFVPVSEVYPDIRVKTLECTLCQNIVLLKSTHTRRTPHVHRHTNTVYTKSTLCTQSLVYTMVYNHVPWPAWYQAGSSTINCTTPWYQEPKHALLMVYR